MAREEVRRDGAIAFLGEAAANILDPLMDAENFVNDDDDGRGRVACGFGHEQRNGEAIGGFYTRRLLDNVVGVRFDGRRGYRLACCGKSCGKSAAHEYATAVKARGRHPVAIFGQSAV